MNRRIRRALLTLSAGSTLLASGCLASVGDAFDLLLSPTAVDNAARLPYSVFGGFVTKLLSIFGG